VDHLGSPRLITNSSDFTASTQSFAPFGAGGATNSGALQFTGQERDAANVGGGAVALPDYFHARYYDMDRGRFLSVDPVIDVKTNLPNPQGWNRYAYVRNNPMRFTDPTGKYLCNGSKDECANFEAALKIVRQAAAEAQQEKTEGAGRLSQIVKLYGALGKDTGVNVVFGSSWGRMDTIVKGPGLVTITVDRNDFASDVAGKRFLGLAASIAHEGDHGLFGRANPIVRLTRSYDMLYRSELSAYRSSGYVYQALGLNDTTRAIWQVDTGWTPNLEHFARQTAEEDCVARGGCR
jgi:RHS repeat-associated protein